MDCSGLDLSLSLKPSYVPKTIANLMKEISNIDNFSDRLVLLNDYLKKHQEELSKVEAFKHQFPHCMLLLLDAIERLKEEIINMKNDTRFESREQLLMEFLSVKRKIYCEAMPRKVLQNYCIENKNYAFMSSSSSKPYELNHDDDHKEKKPTLSESNKIYQAYEGSNSNCALNTFSTIKNETNSKKPEDHQEVAKSDSDEGAEAKPKSTKTKSFRRSWTPDLHAKFVDAVEYLGGPDVATPKLINEEMKVEGLTNDQIKSHLQKYRHSSRIAPTANNIECVPSVSVEKCQDPCSWTSEFYHNQIQHFGRDPKELFTLNNCKK